MDDKCVWLNVHISSPVSLAWWEMMSHLQLNQFLLSTGMQEKKKKNCYKCGDMHTFSSCFPSFLLLQTDMPLNQQVCFLQVTNEEVIAEGVFRKPTR